MDGSQLPGRDAPVSVAAPPRPTRLFRRVALLALVLGAVTAAGAYGRYWFLTGRYLETTDDSYTAADAAAIAPRVAGQIASVLVTDNQLVATGQPLARVDDRDYRAALAAAQADVASATADIGTADAQLVAQQARIDQARADSASARAGVQFAAADFRRYQDLMRSGNGTVQRAEQADADIRQKTAAASGAEAALAGATQQVDVLRAQKARAEAAKLRAEAAAEQARLNLSYTEITSPIAGAVGDRSLRLGQFVQAGTRVMTIVPTGRDIYVVANFKETQLAQLCRGDMAMIAIDMLSGKTLTGRVDSLAPGSGSQFALLPPENATGNFTKIVQRVPVKIMLDAADPATLARLRPGLSVTATIDTRTCPPGTPQTLVNETEPANP